MTVTAITSLRTMTVVGAGPSGGIPAIAKLLGDEDIGETPKPNFDAVDPAPTIAALAIVAAVIATIRAIE